MARTRADNFDDIKAEILAAAARVFADKGFRNANIIDIGTACGASKSRMYHYFPSKEAMLSEMLLEHVNGLLTIARGITASKFPPEEKLRKYVLAHLRYYFDMRDRHKVLLTDADYLPEAVLADVRRSEHQLVQQLGTVLKELNPERFKSRLNTSAHAMLIYGMLNWTHTWYEPEGALSLSSLADKAVDMCLHGVA